MARTQHPTVVLFWLLKELWNYWIYVGSVLLLRRASTADGVSRLRGTCDRRAGRVDVHCAHCWVLRQHAGVVSGVVFENCRVDASIFVVKLLRAHGGCLGFRSR